MVNNISLQIFLGVLSLNVSRKTNNHMANLQHYIYHKLHNKPIMLRSSKLGSKEERDGGVDFTHAFSLIHTNVEP